ncbi:MAG: hypothetical protein GYA33_16340 [Thermogutta sp.]|nr:hypothetical protein [Thermogutta sp.]
MHVEANDPAKPVPSSLVEDLQEREADVIGVIQRGDALLRLLWSNGWSIRLTRPRPDWIVIVPRGPGRNEDQVLRMFFADHRDAAALFASRLPWTHGVPDTSWWNRTSDAFESGRLRLRTDHPKERPE